MTSTNLFLKKKQFPFSFALFSSENNESDLHQDLDNCKFGCQILDTGTRPPPDIYKYISVYSGDDQGHLVIQWTLCKLWSCNNNRLLDNWGVKLSFSSCLLLEYLERKQKNHLVFVQWSRKIHKRSGYFTAVHQLHHMTCSFVSGHIFKSRNWELWLYIVFRSGFLDWSIWRWTNSHISCSTKQHRGSQIYSEYFKNKIQCKLTAIYSHSNLIFMFQITIKNLQDEIDRKVLWWIIWIPQISMFSWNHYFNWTQICWYWRILVKGTQRKSCLFEDKNWKTSFDQEGNNLGFHLWFHGFLEQQQWWQQQGAKENIRRWPQGGKM